MIRPRLKPEEKIARRQEKLEQELAEEEDLFLNDGFGMIRRLYESRIDTIPGCLEIMESLIRMNNGRIPDSENYRDLRRKFRELLIEQKKQGVNIRPFLRQYHGLNKLRLYYKIDEFSSEDGDAEPFNESDIAILRQMEIDKDISRGKCKKPNFAPLVYTYDHMNQMYIAR